MTTLLLLLALSRVEGLAAQSGPLVEKSGLFEYTRPEGWTRQPVGDGSFRLAPPGGGTELLRFLPPEAWAGSAEDYHRAVLKALPKGVEGVGVFMDQPLDEVRKILEETGLGIAQLHGAESPDYARALGVPVIKTFDTFSEPALERLKAYDAFAFLLDLPKGAGPRGRAAIRCSRGSRRTRGRWRRPPR